MTCDSEPLILDLDAVTALGIVVAELVTNSYDHAFPDGNGIMKVAVRRAETPGGMATLTVGDNGVGFTAQTENKRYGLGLVRGLVEQVRGTIAVASESGTLWTIHFPELPVR